MLVDVVQAWVDATQVHVRVQCSALGTPRQHTLAVILRRVCAGGRSASSFPVYVPRPPSRRDIACEFWDLRGVRSGVGRSRPNSRVRRWSLQRSHGPHPPERRPVRVAVDGRRALRDGCCAACVRACWADNRRPAPPGVKPQSRAWSRQIAWVRSPVSPGRFTAKLPKDRDHPQLRFPSQAQGTLCAFRGLWERARYGPASRFAWVRPALWL